MAGNMTRPQRVANEGYIRAMRDLRRSSAASPHVPRPLKGTRTANNRRAINDSLEDGGPWT